MGDALPTKLPDGAQVGLIIALACSGRLISPELVLALSVQDTPTHMAKAFLLVKGKPIDEAREICADYAIKCKAKYLWFIDDDTIPPPNTLRRLVYVLENYPDIGAIGGVYVTKNDPPQPVVFRGMGLGSFWHWKRGDVFEVTGIGAGCLLINTEVFKKIEKPYFEWPKKISYDPQIPTVEISEDISFCNKVRDAGFKVFAHGGILCDHFDVKTGNTYSMPEDSYPLRPEVTISTEGILEKPSENSIKENKTNGTSGS